MSEPKLIIKEESSAKKTRSPPKKPKVEQSVPRKKKLKTDADKAAERAQHLRFGKAEITPDEASRMTKQQKRAMYAAAAARSAVHREVDQYEDDNVLPEHIKLIETRKPEKHFFFRAESFFNHAAELDRQAQLELRKYSKIYAYKAYGGRSLLEQSHGESFLSAFLNYASRNTLFILDEPEAALSPQRQLALLVRIHELVNNGCQLIISTHSPILMAYPNADIYAIDDTGAHITPYEETEHYQLTKYFLTHTEQMMKELLG